MLHQTPLIATVVVGLVLAFILGTLAHRLRMTPLIGYLCAGIVVGPYTPGFVADAHLAQELAEIGVILLMFGVGLHFSIHDLLTVKRVAIPGALLQMAIATSMGLILALALGWQSGESVIFGLTLSCASTVVLLTALQERKLLDTPRGRIAIGWLVVEDMAMVLALVVIPVIAPALTPALDAAFSPASPPAPHPASGSALLAASAAAITPAALITTLAITVAKVIAFIAVMLIIGRRAIPWLLERIAATGSRELFNLCVLAIALGCALGSTLIFGVSFALGAFFAGMMLAESRFNQRASETSLPLRDTFSVLFFVSVGMLVDPAILLQHPLLLLATLCIIVLGKALTAFLLMRAFGHGLRAALTIAASLAQIGEFSFILATLGNTQGLLSDEACDLILGSAILSIMLNPLLFVGLDYLNPWLEKQELASKK